MSSLSDLAMIIFIFSPLVFTITLIGTIAWYKLKRFDDGQDGPERLLSAAVSRMPVERSEWGEAMMAELIHTHGAWFRWQFALGCARVAIFPPATTAWPRYLFDALKRLGSLCGILAVTLPPLGLPFLWMAAIAVDALMEHDNFSFSDGFIPGCVGSLVFVSLACMLCGIPLGIAGLIRREQIRWLSMLGPFLSMTIFSYAVIVMHFVAGGPHGD